MRAKIICTKLKHAPKETCTKMKVKLILFAPQYFSLHLDILVDYINTICNTPKLNPNMFRIYSSQKYT